MLERPVVALTGATGFLGPHIITALTGAGFHVKALTRRPQPETDDQVTWVKGDLSNLAALEDLADGTQAVVHAAGATKALTEKAYFEINAEGTWRVAQATEQASSRMVLVSSLAARAPHLSPYAASKRAAEEAAESNLGESRLAVLRPPGIYGPGDHEFLKLFRAASRGFFPLPPEPNSRVSLVHAADVAAAICTAIQNPVAEPGPFDVHDGKADGYDWFEIAAVTEQLFGKPLKHLRLPAGLIQFAAFLGSAKGRITGRPEVINLRKLPELFHPDWVCSAPQVPGFQPKISLEQGFKGTLAWYKSQNLLKSFD